MRLLFRFAEFTLDPEGMELCWKGEPIPVQPKILAFLTHLIRHRDRTVTRDELFGVLWPDVVVSEANLTGVVRDARRVIGDRGAEQRAIRTVHRRGYRFVALVREVVAGPARVEGPPSHDPGLCVGRDVPHARLHELLDAAAGGGATVAFVSGEPGIGKTRCCDVFAASARSRGLRVYSGWCPRGEAPSPYWPWVPILRSAVAAEGPEQLAGRLGSRAADLALLVPELDEALSQGIRAPRLDPDQARHRLFDAVASCLCADEPVVILLDDIQWADRSSLRLLEFLVRHERSFPLLVVATFRQHDPENDPVLTDLLAELARHVRTERILLSGLEAADVLEWLQAALPERASEAFARVLVERTSGNPFFIQQILTEVPRQPADEALDGLRIPAGIRDLIRQRMSRLSATARELVEVGAILGREFQRDVVEHIAGLDGAACERALAEARTSYLVQELDREAQRWQFVNPLIQEVAYAEQSAQRRRGWHRRSAQVLRGDARVLARLRSSGDPAALTEALLARALYLSGPQHLESRRALARELVDCAAPARLADAQLRGLQLLLSSALEEGNPEQVSERARAYLDAVREMGTGLHQDVARGYEIASAIRGGNLERAEKELAEARAQPQTSEIVQVNHAVQGLWVDTLRGRKIAARVLEGMRAALVPAGYAVTALCVAAFFYGEHGDVGSASSIFDGLAVDGFSSLPDNMFLLFSLMLLARVCARIGDSARAGVLLERLRPFAAQHATGGLWHYLGPASHGLALLAGTLSRWDEAERWFRDAREALVRIGARPLTVIAQRDQAALLRRRRRPGDAASARHLGEEAAREAALLGMETSPLPVWG